MIEKIVSKRVKDFDSSEVRRIFKAASQIRDPINLSIGEPDFDIPDEVKEEAITHIRKGFNKYTHASGTEELRLEIVKKLRTKNKIEANINDVAVTPGVSGGLLVTTLTLFDKDDEVLVLDPYFPTFPELIRLSEAKPIFVSTYPDFSLPLEKIEKSINKRTKAIIINSPNNPAGAVYPEKDQRELSKIARKNDLIVVSDEIYEDYVYEGKHFSIGSIYENTVSLWGFSKTYAMTGWRLGYLVGPKPFMDRVHELLQYLYFSPSSIPQKAAVKALRLGPPEKALSEFKRKRNYIVSNLSSKFDIHGAKGAFYIFAKAPGGNSSEFLEKTMKKKLVFLPGNVFSQVNTHIRLSYSVDLVQIKKAVSILNGLVN
jgi:aspartate aminotransferase/aminotransferase